MNIKLVAIDLDGTLLDSNKKISPRAEKAIRDIREKGVRVTIATGRMFASTRPYAEHLDLELPLITYQGALVKLKDNTNILYQRNVPSYLAQEVVAMAREHGYPLNFYLDDHVLVEKASPEILNYARKYNVEVEEINDLTEMSDIGPIKLLAINEREEELMKFEEKCRDVFGEELYITKSMPEYLEFMHPEATKAKGLEAVEDYLGIGDGETMAIGDSFNDLEMLHYAGVSVVMGNAREEIKAAADYITASNDNDGVAEALEKIILKKEVRF
ncbi:MAG: HAD family phosphatase [Clostridia bacterium]|nr:HAD family phosphatase [Clostridia bacterium]